MTGGRPGAGAGRNKNRTGTRTAGTKHRLMILRKGGRRSGTVRVRVRVRGHLDLSVTGGQEYWSKLCTSPVHVVVSFCPQSHCQSVRYGVVVKTLKLRDSTNLFHHLIPPMAHPSSFTSSSLVPATAACHLCLLPTRWSACLPDRERPVHRRNQCTSGRYRRTVQSRPVKVVQYERNDARE